MIFGAYIGPMPIYGSPPEYTPLIATTIIGPTPSLHLNPIYATHSMMATMTYFGSTIAPISLPPYTM